MDQKIFIGVSPRQGVWCFENYWGYLGRFKTRQVNPEASKPFTRGNFDVQA